MVTAKRLTPAIGRGYFGATIGEFSGPSAGFAQRPPHLRPALDQAFTRVVASWFALFYLPVL